MKRLYCKKERQAEHQLRLTFARPVKHCFRWGGGFGRTSLPARPSSSGTATELPYQQLDNLHILRGFCALYVVAYHAKYLLWAGGTRYLQAFPPASWKLADYLGFAVAVASSASVEMVILFFVLSGFFIRYATRRRPRPALGFYRNRVVRLYPPYLASLALAAAVLGGLAAWQPGLLAVVPGHEQNAGLLSAWQTLRDQPLRGLGRALLFQKAGAEYFGYNSAYWSLLPEAVFYLLVPLAFRWVRLYYWLSAGVYVVGVQVGEMAASPLLGGLLLYNGYFALGSGLYDLLAARPGLVRRAGQVGGGWWTAGLLALLGAIIGLVVGHLRGMAAPLAAGLAVLGIVRLLASGTSRRPPLLRLLHWLGRFSFSLYLYHFPLLLLAYALQVALTGTWFSYGHWYLLAVPGVVLACYGLYWLTERVAVRYFRRS